MCKHMCFNSFEPNLIIETRMEENRPLHVGASLADCRTAEQSRQLIEAALKRRETTGYQRHSRRSIVFAYSPNENEKDLPFNQKQVI